MAIEITMPKLSDTMTEGLFAGWRKNIGDRIERGDIIAEVETDKAVMELEAFASGTLIKTMVHGGENIPVGTVLGLIGEAGESVDAARADQPASGAEPATNDTAPAEAPPQPEPPPSAPGSPAPAQSLTGVSHEKAAPLVRRLAREQGIELERVKGSGPEGRITQEDLAAFADQLPGKTEAGAPSAPVSAGAAAEAKQTAPSPMRQAIVNTVTLSWQTIPHFSATAEINMDICREIVTEQLSALHPIGYNALLIKACATILERFPLLRTQDGTGEGAIHISFAVALPHGLLMPVIRDCNRLTVTGIERESARLIEKCRGGKLSSEEMSGGCFSISNLGMYGVDNFTALVMPGQPAILAIGSVGDRPIVRNGAVVAAATMRVTLSCDHRVVDGAYAAQFLAKLRTLLEKPLVLLV